MSIGSKPEKLNGLYLITDEEERLVERVSEALPYASILQFRVKNRPHEQKLRIGRALAALCKKAGVIFIVNDDPALAVELAADGVHLGQGDGDPAEARKILGKGKLIGVSTHTPQEAAAAEAAGADYIGFGAIFPTNSKDVDHLPGLAGLTETRKFTSLPIVAIGGITRDNAPAVIDAGADAIAVITAVMSRQEPSLAAAELRLLFNRKKKYPQGSVLTIAGSDSGGGAGIQADLKTITLLGSYGASVITALTAQNTLGVTGIHAAPPEFTALQLETVLTDIPVDVIKCGMLFSAEIIAVVAAAVTRHRQKLLVVDPVMIAKGGASLIDTAAVAALTSTLLPLTYLLTPNVPEAEALTGIVIRDDAAMQQACAALHSMGARNILLKGGHLAGDEAVDLFFDGSSFLRLASPRIHSPNTHGTGCTLSAATAAFLARGEPLPVAIARAKEFITAAIRLAVRLGNGHGPVNHFLAAEALRPKENPEPSFAGGSKCQ